MSTMIVPFSFADSLEIIPTAKDPAELGNQVDCVGWDISKCKTSTKPGKTVRDRYNVQSNSYCGWNKVDLWGAFATGIMSWECIIEYIVYIIKFISQVWLLVWVVMIIYAGYKYATAVFTGKTPSSDIIKDAIIWVLVVIFAYAIIKVLTAMFL